MARDPINAGTSAGAKRPGEPPCHRALTSPRPVVPATLSCLPQMVYLERMRRPLAASFLASLLLFSTACVPRSAGGSSGLLSRADERELGRKVLDEVRREFRVLDDPYLADYLTGIGRRLESVAGPQPFEIDFHVVGDSRINAFAVPGGHIFVTSQTILVSNDESELAGVVAHEMGHVEGRHIAYQMKAGARANLAALAAVLAGAFLTRNPQAGAAIATFGLAAAQTQMLQYSRTDEEDADRRAVRTLNAAGYDGWGLVRFMETIQRQSPAPEGVPAYLFTHPLPENRARYLADALPAKKPPAPDDAALGPLWRAQARVLAQDPRPWGLGVVRHRAEAQPRSADAQLALALVLKAAGRYDEAWAALDAARNVVPDDPEILHERASVRLHQGRQAEGIALLEGLKQSGRATGPALLELAWSYLEADEGDKALGALAGLDRRPADAPHWARIDYLRGLALGKVGRSGEARAALGDYYVGQGDRAQARRNYQEAVRLLPPGDLRDRVATDLKRLDDER
ncbi:MAG: M48 family metalloprotease [Deltaproteobacteria bacterium]|nr:M48 family metalloprotease [Deltaproteobacteria bacterium]